MNGTNGKDVYHGTNGNDTYHGKGGDDYIYGEKGKDFLYGDNGNDYVFGESGSDHVWGGYGNDHVYGGSGNDYINGGPGTDYLYGGPGADKFYFDTKDTGDVYQGKADTIYDFDSSDNIYLKGSYSYDNSGSHGPTDGQYSIWQSGSDWVVTYNSASDSEYHDVVVKGADPHNHVYFY
jgi:Ca2+-binding RTX toxin-like protein